MRGRSNQRTSTKASAKSRLRSRIILILGLVLVLATSSSFGGSHFANAADDIVHHVTSSPDGAVSDRILVPVGYQGVVDIVARCKGDSIKATSHSPNTTTLPTATPTNASPTAASPVAPSAASANSASVNSASTTVHRSINFGYENVVNGAVDLPSIASAIQRTGTNAVAINAGRPEWVAFPSKTQGAISIDANKDYVANAIGLVGNGREVTITLDLLSPNAIKANPSLAAVDAKGTRSTGLLSLTAMTEGELADRAVALVGEIARRYKPAAIAPTELFADLTYGEADFASFKKFAGVSD